MRKIKGTVTDANTNALAGTALNTVLRTIPIAFRAVCRSSLGDETFGDVSASLILGTTEISDSYLAILPNNPVNKQASAAGGGITSVERIGFTVDDTIFEGRIKIDEIGSLILKFPGASANAVVYWEAMYE